MLCLPRLLINLLPVNYYKVIRLNLWQNFMQAELRLKSVRLALQPAVGLLLQRINQIPTQSEVGMYLAERSGQRAALTGFINYLNKNYDLNLICGHSEKEKIQAQQRKQKNLENEMIVFIIKSREEQNSIHIIDWIRLSMQYFHDCSYKTSLNLR
jgi:hypothetical protein